MPDHRRGVFPAGSLERAGFPLACHATALPIMGAPDRFVAAGEHVQRYGGPKALFQAADRMLEQRRRWGRRMKMDFYGLTVFVTVNVFGIDIRLRKDDEMILARRYD